MSDLVDFLKARLDEEEQVVRTLDEDYGNQVTGIEIYTDRDYGPIIAIGQKRALADIQAKRRIVATYTELDAHPNRLSYAFIQQQWVALRAVIAALALPYSDHEEYREEWRP